MKKNSLLLFIAFIIFCSMMVSPTQNPWSIRIGKKEILGFQKNKMGDTITLQKSKLKDTDTLYAERNLLSFTASNSVVVLTVKNDQDVIIKDARNTANTVVFAAQMPIKDLLASPEFVKGKMIRIYLTIISRQEKLKETVLMGVIKLK
ncbi:MAG: hypothetical protein JWP12_2657 [Bacteroidetes bacterium]|nr:hypothetical protein [Bacteroidota bacterium]